MVRKRSFWEEKMRNTYYNQFAQGYTFSTNCPIECIEEDKKRYEAQGLEVFVGETAFARDGTRLPSYRTILSRPKRESKDDNAA